MKTIGFIDYYLSEWHANNYPQWIKEACDQLGLEYTVAYAWGEQMISPVDGIDSAAWCERMGVTLCGTIDEVCEKSDVLVVLAPSDPERHLSYAEKVLSYGKPTYIDKTFAPNLNEAKAIFALGERYGTPFFSTSALRYATELDAFEGAHGLMIVGGGGNFPEYVIHQVEMAVTLLREPVRRAKVDCVGPQRLCCLETVSGDRVGMVFIPDHGFAVCGETAEGRTLYREASDGFFPRLIEDMLRFFESGVPPFDGKQTLEAMAIREALLTAEARAGAWVELPSI